MNFLSLNIRGVRSKQKLDWVRQIQRMHNIRFISIQETQYANPGNINIHSVWNNYPMDFDTVAAQGRSGGY